MTATAAGALAQQLRAAVVGFARRSLVAPRTCLTCLVAGVRAGRAARGAAIVRGCATLAAARIVGWADRRGGAARACRLVCASTGATTFAWSLQQLPDSSFGVVGCGAAVAGSAVVTWAEFGTETETSTGAVDTETATPPTWTFTETAGMLTLT